MAKVIVEVVKGQEDLEKAFAIRVEVFVNEQGVPLDIEVDEYDEIAEHVLVYYDNKPVGAARWRMVDNMAKLERICVLAAYRQYGLGKAIVTSLEEAVKKQGLTKAKLHGQVQAADFYKKLGYKQMSDEFMEDGIEHILFVKDL